MNKMTIIGLFTLATLCGVAQNENNTGNAPGNVFNINNPATPIQSQVNYNASLNNDNSPQQFVQGNLNKTVTDNNVSIPQQQAQNSDSGSGNNNNPKNISFNIPKVSFGSAAGGGGSSSGKRHYAGFSKKLKKFNRKMSYVFAKKGKASFRVDNCFAWTK